MTGHSLAAIVRAAAVDSDDTTSPSVRLEQLQQFADLRTERVPAVLRMARRHDVGESSPLALWLRRHASQHASQIIAEFRRITRDPEAPRVVSGWLLAALGARALPAAIAALQQQGELQRQAGHALHVLVCDQGLRLVAGDLAIVGSVAGRVPAGLMLAEELAAVLRAHAPKARARGGVGAALPV